MKEVKLDETFKAIPLTPIKKKAEKPVIVYAPEKKRYL